MKVLCVGEMMVDILVRTVNSVSFQNDSVPVEQIEMKSGGDANNNAIDFSKLGNEAYYVGLVGNDILGDYVLKIAHDAGVNVEYVCRSQTTAQTKSLILINERGDRTFLQYKGTSEEFAFDNIDLRLLDKIDLLQIGGTFHLPRFDGAGAAKLLCMAREKGVTTSMDVTSDRTGRWNSIIENCYPHLDYFLPSIEQAECIAGTKDVKEIANFFLKRGVKTVVVKLGKDGSYCKNSDTAFYCGCYNVPVLESTGAGDAFVAGFLTGRKNGLSLEESVCFGSAASAFAIQALGATAGVPSVEVLKEFIRTNPSLEIKYDA